MFRFAVMFFILLIAAPSVAETPSFNYVEVGYIEYDIDLGDGMDVNGDGFAVGGAFEVGDNFFGFVGYSDVDFDFDIEVSALDVGFGYHTDLTDNTSFYASVAYVEADASVTGLGSNDESGYGVGIGVRGYAAVDVELGLGITYVDLGNESDDTTIGGSFLYDITDNVALGVTVDFGDDEEAYGGVLRVYFAK